MKGWKMYSKIQAMKATSETPWVRGRLARIFLKNAGWKPAYPAKNVVFGGCLKEDGFSMRQVSQVIRVTVQFGDIAF